MARAKEDFEYMDYSTWQPIDRQVLQNPLALLDARSLEEPGDVSPALLGGDTQINRFGGLTMLTPNPKHQWCYFPKMRPDELLLFRGVKHPSEQDVAIAASTASVPGNGRSVAHIAILSGG